MDEIDLSQLDLAESLNKETSDTELSETELDMKQNPEKYMEMENVDFVRAVEILAERAHITLPKKEVSQMMRKLSKLSKTSFKEI